MSKIETVCTCFDISIIFDNERVVLYEDVKFVNDWKHGVCDSGVMQLTIKKAEKLVISLQKSIKVAKALERGYCDYIKSW